VNNLSKILIGILIGVAGIGWLLYGIKGCTSDKHIADLNKLVYDCTHEPVKIVIQATHDTVHDTMWRTPKVVTKTVTIHDTAEKVKWCSINYQDTYKFGSGDSTGSFLIAIHSADCKVKYQIANMVYPVIHKSITKTVIHDSLMYKPKVHYGVTIGIMANNIIKFPPIGAGVFLTLGDKIMIEPGIYYDALTGKLYGKAEIGIFLDKH
jgi:hypothetical protein